MKIWFKEKKKKMEQKTFCYKKFYWKKVEKQKEEKNERKKTIEEQIKWNLFLTKFLFKDERREKERNIWFLFNYIIKFMVTISRRNECFFNI